MDSLLLPLINRRCFSPCGLLHPARSSATLCISLCEAATSPLTAAPDCTRENNLKGLGDLLRRRTDQIQPIAVCKAV